MNAKALFLTATISLVFASLVQAQATSNLMLILDQQRDIAAELDAGYTEGMSDERVERIRKAQERIFEITKGKSNLNRMSTSHKTELANLLDWIKVEMGKGNRTDREAQQICYNERILGSNIIQIRCGTREEFAIRRDTARASLEKTHICVPPNCGQ